MKRDLFQNKYETSNVAKILIADLICFLLVASLSIGFCYAYFSNKVDAMGSTSTAFVAVEYQYKGTGDSAYTQADEVYGKIGNGSVKALTGTTITPGDTLTIVGRAVNVSNVSVYVLAKLEITSSKGTEVVWYNIGTNNPKSNEQGGVIQPETPEALQASEYAKLYKKNGVYQVGAGILASGKYKELAIPYTFEGDKWKNGDTIDNIRLTLLVHQHDYLSNADDFNRYSQYATNGLINGYTTESIYAVHYITGEKL